MASFEKKDFPEISYCITDDYKREAQLTPEQAYELLQWLYERRDELFTSIHPVEKASPSWMTPETLQAWHRAKATVEAFNRDHPFVSAEQEEANRPPSVRYLELHLNQHEWTHLDVLKAAIPALHEEYPVPVKVLSVRTDSLTLSAVKLINDLQVEYEFRDQLMPVEDEEEEPEEEDY